jgi:DNA-binding transcriptional LysR family regulator
MQDLNDLYYFVQVVDHGGFAAAARATGLQKSKLSRRVQQLEERMGVRLLNRSSRQFSTTELGRAYYERCVAMLVEAEAADQVLAQVSTAPRGIIRVSCPVALTNFQFGALFARFLGAYPDVVLHLESTNRRVDVIGEGFDVAIRVRFPPLESSELVMRKLDISTLGLVASPAFLAGRSIGSPADLRGTASLTLGPARRDYQWELEHADGRTAHIGHVPRLVSDDMAALCDAAIAGVGVAALPTMMVWRQVKAGQLVRVLPDWQPPAGIVHAVFPSRRGLLPSIRTLLDFLAAECGEARRRAEG